MSNVQSKMASNAKAPHIQALRDSGLLEAAGEKHFEPHIALVRQVLSVPVAVISLLEEDRQIFAAHQGLPPIWADRGETPLTHSFCQYVVADRQPLRVPNALQHPILKDNLAIPDLGVVAYLGVPLTLPDGQVIGALAAIDGHTREWTEADMAMLQSLATVVIDKISTFISELSWRAMFEQLREGIIVGQVIRDHNGKITDWRYLEVNKAWGELVGIDTEFATGKTIREVFPGIEDEWVNEFAEVVETGRPIKFTRQVGSLSRWYDGYAQATGTDTFIVLFMEVTERVAVQRALTATQDFSTLRQSALIEIGDRLRQTTDVQTIVEIISEVVSRTLGASRVGYGEVDSVAETIEISADWHADNLASLAGLHHFRDYGSFIEDLKRGTTVSITDVTTDPRTANASAALLAIGIRVLINVPIMEHGQLSGVMLVHFDHLHPFSKFELDFVRAVADRTQSAISHANGLAAEKLREGEITHRLKNSMAMVQAIAVQTLQGEDIAERRLAFTNRLSALSTAHDVLVDREWVGATLEQTVTSALAPHTMGSRISFSGPHVELNAKQALSMSLAVHELATNATKYGALSKPEGNVKVEWGFDEAPGDQPKFYWTWTEANGPPVVEPARKGFGTRLITRVLPADFKGKVSIQYQPEGVICHLLCPAPSVLPDFSTMAQAV